MDTLTRALQLHQAGRLDQAEALYRRLLAVEPSHGDALQLLGLILLQRGQAAAAIEYMERAITLGLRAAFLFNNLGEAYRACGRLAEALPCYQRALELNPDDAGAHNNRGTALQTQGQLVEAESCYRRALALQPNYPEAATNLALLLHGLGRLVEAEASCRHALTVRPEYAEAHNSLGLILQAQGRRAEAESCYRTAARLAPQLVEAHCNLGNLLSEAGRPGEAIACYQQALALRPRSSTAHNQLGNVHLLQGRLDEAEAYYRRAVEIEPGNAPAQNNLGIVARDRGRLDEAEAAVRQAIAVQPDYAEGHHNLGAVLLERGRVPEAIAAFEQAVRLRPEDGGFHYNLAKALLLAGEFPRGWAETEWRWRGKEFVRPPLAQPLWDGGPLAGRTLLLHSEQGAGDTLQMIRYAPRIQQRGGRVVVLCREGLVTLLRRCPGVAAAAARLKELPAFDAVAYLLSLPGLLGTTSLAEIPAQVPYLAAEPERVERWQQELAQQPGYRVGIAWQGSPTNANDRQRSVPLTRFESLARVPGVQLYSLQQGAGSEQLDALAGRFPVIDLGRLFADFNDTAAAVVNLDLVVSVDTAIAHLAGALAVPIWLAVPFAPDWRWLRDRPDSPWYPTMRLFRQPSPRAWDPVFQRLAAALAEVKALAVERPGQRPAPAV